MSIHVWMTAMKVAQLWKKIKLRQVSILPPGKWEIRKKFFFYCVLTIPTYSLNIAKKYVCWSKNKNRKKRVTAFNINICIIPKTWKMRNRLLPSLLFCRRWSSRFSYFNTLFAIRFYSYFCNTEKYENSNASKKWSRKYESCEY